MPSVRRTHGCGELTEAVIGQTVTLCGWLHRRRDHGGLTFFDLRDRSGLAQIVFNAKRNAELHQQVKTLGPEYVLGITGKVGRAPRAARTPSSHRGWSKSPPPR